VTGYLDAVAGDVRRDAPEPARGFADALVAGPAVAVIAEIKRASPSEGTIAPAADVAATARAYAGGGAAAMSVLCAARDFAGSLDDLAAARRASPLPAIAKDFTVFPEQVAAQRLAGADAILVILAMVTDDEARRLLQTAALLGLDALVETHDAAEVERALALEAAVIGVNARDLRSLAVDRDRQLGLLAELPAEVVRVAESGIGRRADVVEARDAGADAVLVGTALMREPALLGELVGVERR
jgi:indole-3-glycerol phosphate synthase